MKTDLNHETSGGLICKAKAAFRLWFGLTAGERKAVALILAVALVGLSVKCWHASAGRRVTGLEAPRPAPLAAQERE